MHIVDKYANEIKYKMTFLFFFSPSPSMNLVPRKEETIPSSFSQSIKFPLSKGGGIRTKGEIDFLPRLFLRASSRS